MMLDIMSHVSSNACTCIKMYLIFQLISVPYCNAPADIVFILDSSNSIWPPNFTKQLNFVTKLVKKFDIGQAPTQTRIGLLTFGHKVWKKFDLRDKIDESEVIQAVTAINHDRGRTTNTADAIEFAMKNMFTSVAGSRKGVAQIAVVITDGRSQETRRTSKAARNVRSHLCVLYKNGECDGIFETYYVSEMHETEDKGCFYM